ncbi:MAG: magnesium transporter [Leptospiraceae bacterium]|nr:magnesium transporter [Leptospiraceae bacterium]MCP5510694.1 magnesium transporter [Leptospiraceae bacterium]
MSDKMKNESQIDNEVFDIGEIEEFLNGIKKRDEEIIKFLIQTKHPADIADIIEFLDEEDALFLFRRFDVELQRKVFVEFTNEEQAEFVELLDLHEISQVLEQLESDDIAYLFSELDKNTREILLNTINKEDSDRIRSQLTFKENTAGRLMNLDFAWIRSSENARNAIRSLRKAARETDDLYVIYVLDEDGKLAGMVTLKDLLIANSNSRVSKFIQPVQSIHYDTDQEEVALFFKKYHFLSAPVIDDDNRMIGRITMDDVLDIVEEEATEDIYRMGGVSEDESLASGIVGSVKKRILWLVMNLGIAMITTSVVSFYEDTIQRLVILASLMPIVAGMGGNAGTQAITIMVRGFATGELNEMNWFTVIRRELAIGFINGILVGSITVLVTYLVRHDIQIASVMGMAMMFNLLIAGLVGSSVPLILKYFKIDPAIGSSIFVTASTDMFGFFCFLGLATLLL